MIIYLEGPDGSGKSTLTQHICKALDEHPDVRYINPNARDLVPTHPNRPDIRMNEKALFAKLRRMALDNEVHILDRCFISDCIYRIFDDFAPVTNIHKCIEFLNKHNKRVFTIYCRTANAEDFMLKRGDDNPIAIKKHKEITKAYDMIMSLIFANVKYNCFKYDFTKKRSINELLGAINYFVAMNS